jgi:hypothetical protein
MSAGYGFSASTPELLAGVVKRLEAEFSTMPRDQVVRCVQMAREPAKEASGDPGAFANIVEALAGDYLAKIHAMRTKTELPPPRHVVQLNGVEAAEPPGRHAAEPTTGTTVELIRH